MSTTEHYIVDDPIGDGAEPMPAPPEREPEPGHFVTDPGPEPPPPEPFVSLPLETILAALRRLVIPTREVAADDWAAWRVNLEGAATYVVANRNGGRRKLTVRNLAAAAGPTAYLSSRPNVSPAGINTYPVAAGESVTLDATGPVYACTDDAATVQLAIVAEYDTAAGGEL